MTSALLLAGCIATGSEDELATRRRDGGADAAPDADGLSTYVGCPAGLTRCGDRCADLSVNRGHCGACGNVCAADEACLAGKCDDGGAKEAEDAGADSGCTGTGVLCGAGCVDVDSDSENCGACGATCPGGWGCKAGKCDVVCSAPMTDCSGLCVDITSTRDHCGGCGKACPAGMGCAGSTCQLVCTGSQTKCGDRCADLSKDSSNCGACGHKCGFLQFCVLGVCLP